MTSWADTETDQDAVRPKMFYVHTCHSKGRMPAVKVVPAQLHRMPSREREREGRKSNGTLTSYSPKKELPKQLLPIS